MTKIAFFDAKPYDKPGFEKYGPPAGIEFKYYESKLDADTAGLAEGCAGVVAFVNDSLNAPTLLPCRSKPVSPFRLKLNSRVLLYAL